MQAKKNRRQFVQAAALAAAAPLVGAAAAEAQGEPKNLPASPAKNLLEIIRARHGKNLTEAQYKSIEQRLAQAQASAALLRRTPLTNGDEPAFVFMADV